MKLISGTTSTLKKLKSQSVTGKQNQVMVDYLRSYQELMRGKFTSTFTHAIAAKQWAEFGEILNSVIGVQARNGKFCAE